MKKMIIPFIVGGILLATSKQDASLHNYSQQQENIIRYEANYSFENPLDLKIFTACRSPVINERFIEKIIEVESNYNPRALSQKGAMGLMQVMPDTWTDMNGRIGYSSAFDPDKNRKTGVSYLKWLENRFSDHHIKWNNLENKERRKLIAAAYNGGFYKFKHKALWQIPNMPKETREYVRKLDELGAFN